MGDAEKKHLASNDLVRRLIIENFSNSSRRKGLPDEVVHLDPKRSLEKRRAPQPHRHSDWMTTSPKLSRSSTPKSTIGLTTGTIRDSVVPSKYPSSKYSFPFHQDTSSTPSSSAARPLGYGRVHPEVRYAESESNCGSYFGASASNRSINRSNCNAIVSPESAVSRTSLAASSSSWQSCSRMNSVSDVGWSRAASVPGRNGSCADVVPPPGELFQSLLQLKTTANPSSELFGSHRPPDAAYDHGGLRSAGSLLSTAPPPPPPRSVLFAARTQDSGVLSSSNNNDRVVSVFGGGCRNTALQRTGDAPSTKICEDPDETAKIYPCYGRLIAGRAAAAMGPRPDPAPKKSELFCPPSAAASWHRPNGPGESACCGRPSAAGTEDPCPVDWDSRSSRLQSCYDDDDDVNDDNDDDDDDDSVGCSVAESNSSLVNMSSRCGSLVEAAGQLGSPIPLDAFCLTPEDPVSDGFCDGDDKDSEEEDEEEEEEEEEREVCPWPDEWFPVAPDLQSAVARLALKSLRDGEAVARDLSRLKDANILPPDFFIPEEDDGAGGGTRDLERGVEVSRSLLKVVARRLVRRLVSDASSSCKTEAASFEDDPEQLKSFARQLRRELRKTSTSKSSNCCGSSSSSNSGINVSANNSVMARPRSMPPLPPELSREGLLLFLRCLVELERRTRSLRGGTRGRHTEQQHSERRGPSTGTGSQRNRKSSPGNETVLPGDKTRRSSSKSEDSAAAARLNDSGRRKRSTIEIQDDDAGLSGYESHHSGGEKDRRKKRHGKRHSEQSSKTSRSPEPQSENHNETGAQKRRSAHHSQDRLEKADAGSGPSIRPDLSRNPRRSLENLVADVVRGLYSMVRGKLESPVDPESVEAMSLALLRPRRADLEVQEFVLMTVIEHIVWLVRQHHPRQNDDIEGIVRTLAGDYVDTIITNAVLKIGDGHAEARHS